MIRFVSMAMAGIVVVGLMVNMSVSQDDKKPDPKGDDKKGTKGMIPAGWKKLNLSADQKKKIYSIQADYRPKIKALEEQINKLRAQEYSDMVKVLDDKQRAQLAKDLIPDDSKKDPSKDKPNPPKDKSETKKNPPE